MSRAVASARSAWSSTSIGAPKTARKPSPSIRDEGAPVLEDRVARLVEVLVQRLEHELRRTHLREGREATEVREHNCPDASHAAEPEVLVGSREHVVDDMLGEKPRKDVADAGPLDVMKPLLREARVDPGSQDHRIERLRKVVVRADLDTTDDAVDLVDRRDHDHRDVVSIGHLLEPPEYRHTVEPRHHDVEQDHIGRLLREQLQRLGAILGGADVVPILLEQANEQLAANRVVVRNEYRCSHQTTITRWTRPSGSAHTRRRGPLTSQRLPSRRRSGQQRANAWEDWWVAMTAATRKSQHM